MWRAAATFRCGWRWCGGVRGGREVAGPDSGRAGGRVKEIGGLYDETLNGCASWTARGGTMRWQLTPVGCPRLGRSRAAQSRPLTSQTAACAGLWMRRTPDVARSLLSWTSSASGCAAWASPIRWRAGRRCTSSIWRRLRRWSRGRRLCGVLAGIGWGVDSGG